MKFRQILFGFSTVVLVLLSACETDATVDPPAFVKRPVVVSYISPKDSLVKVQIAYTSLFWTVQS